MADKFPSSESLSVGTFWRAHPPADSASPTTRPWENADGPTVPDPDDVVAQFGGACRVEDNLIEVDVVGELSTSMVGVPGTGGSISIRQPDDTGFDIHGSIPIQPWQVSFLDCRTKRRESNILGRFVKNKNSHHVLDAVWSVVGAHVTSGDRFTGIRMRVSGLEEWAQTPGFEQTMTTDKPLKTALNYTHQPKVTAPFTLFDENANIEVETVASVAPIGVHGSQIRRWNRLALTGLSGWTLKEAMTSFVLPVQTLMTLLTGAPAKVLTVEVHVDDRWCEVFGRYVDGGVTDARPTTLSMLLPADVLTLEHLVTWLKVARAVAPAPQVVAAGLSGEFKTVDTEALVMATSAESLDRQLRPGIREFEQDVITQAREVLATAAIDERLRDKVVQAVAQHMWEPSMPKRLEMLADHVSQAAPNCVGKTKKWKNAVTEMRHNGAHGLETARPPTPGTSNTASPSVQRKSAGPDEADRLAQLYTLAISVRWALRIRVLQECGVSDEALTTALNHSTEYQRDRSRWAHHWPKIYGQNDTPLS